MTIGRKFLVLRQNLTKCHTQQNIASTKSHMRPIVVLVKLFSTNCHAPQEYIVTFC